jgi:riboflavin transporter FmnP
VVIKRIFEQERTPVFTAISFLTTVLALAVIIVMPFLKYRDWGGIVALVFPWLALQAGLIVNCIAGVAAHARGEYLGGRIAAIGAALLLITEFGFLAFRWRLGV